METIAKSLWKQKQQTRKEKGRYQNKLNSSEAEGDKNYWK